jgi:hypothetical protein
MTISTIEYLNLRDRVAGDIRRGIIHPSIQGIADGVKYGANLTHNEAAEFTERFFFDLRRRLNPT